MTSHRKISRRAARRRSSDTRWHIVWPMIVYFIGLLLTGSGLYYGITQKLAVQDAIFAERTQNMKDQIASLQRNLEGLQRYIVDLHRQGEIR